MTPPPGDLRSRILAELYDWEHDALQADVALYRAFARRTGGPVLELACGSGRVLEGLAEDGLEVTGVDISAAMLDRAKARLGRFGPRVHLVETDIGEMTLPEIFSLILAPLDAIGFAPSIDAQVAVLRRIGDHLSDNGLFVFDVTNPGAMEDQPQGIPVLQQAGFCETLGASVAKWIVRRVSAASQTIELSCFYDVTSGDDNRLSRYEEVVGMRYFSRFEVELLLASAGLRLDAVYGDYDLGPFTDRSERLIGVASTVQNPHG